MVVAYPSHGGSGEACTCAEEQVKGSGHEGLPLVVHKS